MEISLGRAMATYQPVTKETDAIVRPACPQCGHRMMLARIEPDSPGYDRRSFECPDCGHERTVIVEFN